MKDGVVFLDQFVEIGQAIDRSIVEVYPKLRLIRFYCCDKVAAHQKEFHPKAPRTQRKWEPVSLTPDSRLTTFLGADEKNRTSTASRPQASETCASTSSATSA